MLFNKSDALTFCGLLLISPEKITEKVCAFSDKKDPTRSIFSVQTSLEG